jgi:hypothetical protein
MLYFFFISVSGPYSLNPGQVSWLLADSDPGSHLDFCGQKFKILHSTVRENIQTYLMKN